MGIRTSLGFQPNEMLEAPPGAWRPVGWLGAFALSAAILDETQPAISFRKLVEFVNIYQSVATLDHGELWALPSMLRLACLEKLGHAFAELDPDLAPPFDPSPLKNTTCPCDG